MNPTNDLNNSPLHSRTCGTDATKATSPEINSWLTELSGWVVVGGSLQKTFAFKNYYQTISLVNAIAWISHQQDHHPDMEVSYSKCTIRYSTHSVGGLSENDFICAAKVEALGSLS